MLTTFRGKTQETGSLFTAPMTPERQRAENWLSDRLVKGRKYGFFIEPKAVLITPVLAEAMLVYNSSNRPMRRARVARFVRILKEGRWVVHAQGVSFSREGVLDNGQHRLQAIVDSGVPAHMAVAFGQTADAYAVMDTQGARTMADTLHKAGEQYSALLGSSSRMLKLVLSGQARNNAAYDNDELLAFLEQHPELRESCKYSYAGLLNKAAPTPFVVAHYLISQADLDSAKIALFFETIGNGLGLVSKRDPIWVLRKALRDNPKKGGWGSRVEIAASIIIAWNSWARGKRLASVDWGAAAAFPVVE